MRKKPPASLLPSGFLTFVCPEPVLANISSSSIYYNSRKENAALKRVVFFPRMHAGVAAEQVRGVEREQVMTRLLASYDAEGQGAPGRVVKRARGRPLSEPLRAALLAELRGTDWASTMRERRSVNAQGAENARLLASHFYTQ